MDSNGWTHRRRRKSTIEWGEGNNWNTKPIIQVIRQSSKMMKKLCLCFLMNSLGGQQLRLHLIPIETNAKPSDENWCWTLRQAHAFHCYTCHVQLFVSEIDLRLPLSESDPMQHAAKISHNQFRLSLSIMQSSENVMTSESDSFTTETVKNVLVAWRH